LTQGVDKLLNPDKYPRVKKVKEVKTEKKEVKEENQNPSQPAAESPLDKGDVKKEEIIEQSQPVEEVKTEEVKEEIKEEIKTEE